MIACGFPFVIVAVIINGVIRADGGGACILLSGCFSDKGIEKNGGGSGLINFRTGSVINHPPVS